MKPITIKYGANIILYAVEVGEVLPQLSREHFIIFSRNGELPNENQYGGTENSLLALQPYLIPLILGLRINLEAKMYKFSAHDLFSCIKNEVPKLADTVVELTSIKFIDIDFVVNSVFSVSDLDMEFVLGFRKEINEYSKISILDSFNISTDKTKITDVLVFPNNQIIAANDFLNLLTFTNNKNLYRLAIMDTL